MPRTIIFTLCFAFAGCATGPVISPGGAPSASAGAEVSADGSVGVPENQAAQVLPNRGLSAFVAAVDPTDPSEGRDREISVLKVDVADPSSDSVFFDLSQERGSVAQPLLISNELIVLFEPTLSPNQALAAIEDHGLQVVHSLPQIGAVVVNASELLGELDDAVGENQNLQSLTELANLRLSQLASDLSEDPRLAEVTPNTAVTSFSIKTSIQPKPASMGGSEFDPSTEESDWGIGDANIDDVWPELVNQVDVGIIDIGFAERHVDLVMTPGLPFTLPKHDHGTHVTGIMCAKHNGEGVRGVLKNCNAKISSGSFFMPSTEDPNIVGFYASFSELLATVLDFMEANPDVKTINLSLGYNWMPNFGIDPRAADAAQIRDLIRAQGRMFLSILAYAQARDIAIVAAAGNDSSNLTTPLPAKWASPFNFGSLLWEQKNGWTNGVVVQAHDENSNRAKFSNVGGHISCPGEDILSTVWKPANGYGISSGTSMASPYCAGGLAALRDLRPDLSLREAIQCLRSSPNKVEGVPKLDLHYSVRQCPRVEQ